ncbi:MAG TPA: hypothetical protein VLG50_08260 [Candidatus Saccharimonadales bacterium]|nr:hypothetical protein [Candidatus Saccharimonadales bacterium]
MEPTFYKTIELKLQHPVRSDKLSLQFILSNNVNFNPSIAHIVDDFFLISFYTWRRKDKPISSSYQLTGSVTDPYHQYYGGQNSPTWWREDEYWGTGYVLATIINQNITIIKYLGYNNYCFDMKLSSTNFGISGTSNCGGGKIYIHNFVFVKNGNDVKLTSTYPDLKFEGVKLCKYNQVEEKNWSMYEYNEQMYISQWLYPHHIVLVKSKENKCIKLKSKNVTVFQHIMNYYNKSVLFSLSTPAIPYYNLMMGVGHVKIVGDIVPPYTTAYRFVQNDYLKHPVSNMSYLMFFYVFDPITLDIVRISPGFYPPNITHGVVFASGLTKHDNDYIISYGEGDAKMKFLFINNYAIDRLLSPVKYYDHGYEFIYLNE